VFLAPAVNDVVRKKSGITPENGRSASQYFETFEQFGLNLQEAFVAHQARPACKGIKAIKPLAAAARQPDSEG
jgi:plasmid maintenance system antidote protein VapI